MNYKTIFTLAFLLLLNNILFGQEENKNFWKAAKTNDTASLQKLIAEGIDVNVATEYGATALTYAADKEHLEAVVLLLENGANPNQSDNFYQSTPFLWVLFGGNTKILKAMIEHGADISDERPLIWATSMGNSKIVELLVRNKAAGSDKAILSAIQNDNLDVFKAILEESELEKEALSIALMTAMAKDNKKMSELLKKKGAEIIKQPETDPELESKMLSYKGLYKNTDGSKANMNVENGSLFVIFDGSNPFELKHTDSSAFQFVQYPDLTIVFDEIESKVISFKLNQGERIIQYFKTEEEIADNKNAEKDSQTEIIETHKQVEKAKNWPSFRGEYASGNGDGQFPPTKWDIKKGYNVKWKTYIPGLAHASPVVWDDKVYIATALSGDKKSEYRVGLYGDVKPVDDFSEHIWSIYCLNKTTGEIIWEKEAYKGVPRVQRHTKATQCNSTPATDGKHVVALFGSEGLVCYTMDGKELWRKDLGILDAGWFYDEETQWGHSSSPIIYENTVIVQCDRSSDSYMAAYDLETGNEVWKIAREEISSWGTPTIYKGKDRDELITNATKFIRSNNPKTGEEFWRLTPNSEITVATPVFLDSIVFITAGYPPVFPVYAIKAGGSGDISIADSLDSGEFILWRNKRGGTYMPSPLAYKGYFYTLANNGKITCYNAQSGEKMYSERIRDGKAFTASLVAADGKIYCTSEEEGVFVIKAGPEFEIICKNTIGEICMATPAISDGSFFVRGQNHVYCLSIK